jgi:hypothetical protein
VRAFAGAAALIHIKAAPRRLPYGKLAGNVGPLRLLAGLSVAAAMSIMGAK